MQVDKSACPKWLSQPTNYTYSVEAWLEKSKSGEGNREVELDAQIQLLILKLCRGEIINTGSQLAGQKMAMLL